MHRGMVPRWLLAGLIAGALLERITKRSRRKKGEGKGDLLDVRNGARDFRVERAHHGELLQSIQEEELAEDAQAEAVDNQDRDGEPLLSGPNEQLLNGLHTNPNLSGDSAGNGLLTLAPVMDQNVEPLERVEPEDLSSADQTAMTESPEEQASHDIEIEDGDMLEVEQGWAESAEATDVVIEPRMLDGTDPSVDGEGQDDQEAHANEDLVLPSADQSASQENVEAR